MIAIADKLGLPEVAASIYRTQSMKWIKEGKLGMAVDMETTLFMRTTLNQCFEADTAFPASLGFC